MLQGAVRWRWLTRRHDGEAPALHYVMHDVMHDVMPSVMHCVMHCVMHYGMHYGSPAAMMERQSAMLPPETTGLHAVTTCNRT